jgi:FtsP/CotA-like multicopper oxidase with cupredoxin domain
VPPAPWIDLIINNLDDGSHPFHLHGHSFYVLASHKSERGWGSYSPWSEAASNAVPEFNLDRPLRKDTVSVPRRGFAVLRFRADNTGLWMLHCHVLVHLGSGMAIGVEVGGVGRDEEGEGRVLLDEGARELCLEA